MGEIVCISPIDGREVVDRRATATPAAESRSALAGRAEGAGASGRACRVGGARCG